MGTVTVRSINAMNMENRRFINKIRLSEQEMIRRIAKQNELYSKKILVEPLSGRGGAPITHSDTLVSSIQLKPISGTKYRVMVSSAIAERYGGKIESGIPPQGHPLTLSNGKVLAGNWITFNEMPALENWVITKLNRYDSNKADYFRRVGAVKVGDSGFPYTFVKGQGVKFMERGFEFSVMLSDKIVEEELNNLNKI